MKKIKMISEPKKATKTKKPSLKKKKKQDDKSTTLQSKLLKHLPIIAVTILIVIGAGSLLYWRWNKQISNSATSSGEASSTACTNILDPKCWTEAFRPQLDKFNNKTNILIIGIDTRASGSGSGLKNTDTILLGTYYHDTGESRMISFPRDLYAPYGCTTDNLPYRSKINAIYAYGQIYCDSKDGMATLGSTIEKMTGEKIQYSAIVRLEGVVEGIDEIGGITVEIPEDHIDVYPYIELPPEEQANCTRARTKPGSAYCVYEFKEGTTPMDGQTALIYARMRYWSDDFDRARRQQEVITAVKEKIVGEDLPIADKSENLLKLSTKLGSKVEFSKLDLDTVLAGLDAARSLDKDPIRVVINPSFGGGGYIYSSNNNYNFRDYSFTQLKDQLDFIGKNPDLYRDSAKIYALNQTGGGWNDDNPVWKMKGEGYWFMDFKAETKDHDANKSGVEIIDFTNGEKQDTVDIIKSRYANFNVTVVDGNKNGLSRSSYGEDIAVHVHDLQTKADNTAE